MVHSVILKSRWLMLDMSNIEVIDLTPILRRMGEER